MKILQVWRQMCLIPTSFITFRQQNFNLSQANYSQANPTWLSSPFARLHGRGVCFFLMLSHLWNVFNELVLPKSCIAQIQGRPLKLVRTVSEGCSRRLTRWAYKIPSNSLEDKSTKPWFPQMVTWGFRGRSGRKRIAAGMSCVTRSTFVCDWTYHRPLQLNSA